MQALSRLSLVPVFVEPAGFEPASVACRATVLPLDDSPVSLESLIHGSPVDLEKIALRVASSCRRSFDPSVERLITQDLKDRFGISGAPFDKGSQSAVYENDSGNIVSFMRGSQPCDVAYESVGKSLSTLPDVYDVDVLELGGEKICVVEMEKLRTLSAPESGEFWNIRQKAAKAKGAWAGDVPMEDVVKRLEGIASPSRMEKAALDFYKRLQAEGVSHEDVNSDNVAWGKNGKLKLIDWESILLS